MKILLTLFLALFSLNAAAQFQQFQFDFSDKEMAITYDAIGAKTGPVTKVEYEDFWRNLGNPRVQDRAQAIAVIKNRVLKEKEYQKAIWACMEDSWNAKEVVRCSNGRNSLALLRTEKLKLGKADEVRSLEEASNALLSAAAKHGSIKSSDGSEVTLSLDAIKAKRVELDKKYARFLQVLKPSY